MTDKIVHAQIISACCTVSSSLRSLLSSLPSLSATIFPPQKTSHFLFASFIDGPLGRDYTTKLETITYKMCCCLLFAHFYFDFYLLKIIINRVVKFVGVSLRNKSFDQDRKLLLDALVGYQPLPKLYTFPEIPSKQSNI